MGDAGYHKRLTPVRATPEGEIHYEDDPIPVIATVKLERPHMEMRCRGYAVAWTRNAVLVIWWQLALGGQSQETKSGWLPPADVERM